MDFGEGLQVEGGDRPVGVNVRSSCDAVRGGDSRLLQQNHRARRDAVTTSERAQTL
jgi:hypothetical protein